MSEILIFLQIIMMILFIIYLFNNNKNNYSKSNVIDKENKKEMEKLINLRRISLTEPLTEKSRPISFEEIVGQNDGIKALKAAICGPNPQHVIIYGPPGVGKTAAARLVLKYAKEKVNSPFRKEAKFVEMDATTLRFDERGIADPLIGSVHDPIYQGAGSLGVAGIPQPKPGAVTKAHGGVLFIDEIGELHPIELNKLLKVLEDRKVFLDSSYYSSEDPNMPSYIKEIFERGLPADFRLIGATTKSPEDISPAIRSRCVEVYFKALDIKEIKEIASNAIKKINLKVSEKGLEIISSHCSNGREVVNLVQLCSGVAINEERDYITEEDILWVIENGEYHEIIDKKIRSKSEVGVANGLAVYGTNLGVIMEIEATAKISNNKNGTLKISGIIEEEEISTENRKMIRKSTAFSSVEHVITVLNNIYDLDCDKYNIHLSIPGGVPVDGPSAGITIAVAIYSAITNKAVDNTVAMTGELSILGDVKPVGGIIAKIMAAYKSGAKKVLIPIDNYTEGLLKDCDIEILPVRNIMDVIKNVIIQPVESIDILSAKRM